MTVIRESWNEEAVLAFAFESETFERKFVSKLLSREFETAFAKALSAFANSNGGHILLGVRDDGTIVGLDPIAKGRTRTFEWLNQKTSELLAPNLKGFKIHPIGRQGDQSQIPEGQLLFVIDIEASDMAPHQSTVDYVYYYRVGAESKRAPHRYIESLFGRQRFPGPNVGAAWIQSVINPLLDTLRFEQKNLQAGHWGLQPERRGSLGCGSTLVEHEVPPNWTQFFDSNREIADQLMQHDVRLMELIETVFAAFDAVSEAAVTDDLLGMLTTIESLSAMKKNASSTDAYKLKDCVTREEYLRLLFSTDDPARNTKHLIDFAINRRPAGVDCNFGPLWNAYRDDVVSYVTETHSLWHRKIVDKAFSVNLEIDRAVEMLKASRETICFKYGLPYEMPSSDSPKHYDPWQWLRPSV